MTEIWTACVVDPDVREPFVLAGRTYTHLLDRLREYYASDRDDLAGEDDLINFIESRNVRLALDSHQI